MCCVCRALSHDPDADLSTVPDLSHRAQSIVEHYFSRSTSRVVKRQVATDGTVKLLVELQDGFQVECVVMAYDTTGAAPPLRIWLQEQVTKQLHTAWS